jgi:hypothetical protein
VGDVDCGDDRPDPARAFCQRQDDQGDRPGPEHLAQHRAEGVAVGRDLIRARARDPAAAEARPMARGSRSAVDGECRECRPRQGQMDVHYRASSQQIGARLPTDPQRVMCRGITEATPSITSPSLGTKSPVSTSTRSPGFNAAAATSSNWRVWAPAMRFALVSVRMRRSVSACALPRPSATAWRNWRTAR